MRQLNIELNDTLYERLSRKKKDDGFAEKSWQEWLSFTCKDTLLFPTTIKMIATHGVSGLFEMWMTSFGQNLPDIWEGHNLRELARPEGERSGRAIIVGAGPSIDRRGHLKLLQTFYGGEDLQRNTLIIATDRMLVPCMKAGILPNYVVTVDGSDKVLPFYSSDAGGLKGSQSKVNEVGAIICSQTHPKVIEAIKDLGMTIYWFHPATDLINAPNSMTKALLLLTRSKRNPDGLLAQMAGGNVGTTSLIIAINVLKRKEIGLIGLDFSYPKDMPLSETYYYDRSVEHVGYLQTNVAYEEFYHPCFNTWAKIDPVFISYRDTLYEELYRLPEDVEISNCTEGGVLHHRNMRCMRFGDWLTENGGKLAE